MLQTKAKETAHRLQAENFQASNWQLESYRTRHYIHTQCLTGESSVGMEAAENWKLKLKKCTKWTSFRRSIQLRRNKIILLTDAQKKLDSKKGKMYRCENFQGKMKCPSLLHCYWWKIKAFSNW
jgi:hypothetical protein